MQNTNIESQALRFSDKLGDALIQLGCCRTERTDKEIRVYEPERTPYYDIERNLIIIAVDTGQFPSNVTPNFFNTRKSQVIFKNTVGQQVKALAKNGTLYFRLKAKQAQQPVAA